MRDARNDGRRSDPLATRKILLRGVIVCRNEPWIHFLREVSETSVRCLESSTTKTTMKKKAVSSSCGCKGINSRERNSPEVSILKNSPAGSFSYEKRSETQEDCNRAFNSYNYYVNESLRLNPKKICERFTVSLTVDVYGDSEKVWELH